MEQSKQIDCGIWYCVRSGQEEAYCIYCHKVELILWCSSSSYWQFISRVKWALYQSRVVVFQWAWAYFLKEYVIVLKPLSRGLTGHFARWRQLFFGTLLSTLETIIKKVVAVQADLSSMIIGLAGAIEDAIRHHFEKMFQNDSAILAAVTSQKFKLKWVESQNNKDLYKQMLIQ